MTRRVCAHPDCNAGLLRTNTSDVCQKHRHHKGYCKCSACMGKTQRPVVTIERPGVRTVEVRAFPIGYSTNDGIRHRISLPKEPWHDR